MKASLLQVDLSTGKVHAYHIDNEENRVIRDVEAHGHFVSCLYDKNEVVVYDSRSKQRVFRTVFKDCAA